MNDRFRNDRGRGGQAGWQGNDRGRARPGDESRFQAQASERQYSSDEDETLGSEWERDRAPRYGQSPSFGQGSSFDQAGAARYGQAGSSARNGGSGFYNRGHAGMYGGGGGAGYVGGHGASGLGGSTGTDYGPGSYGGSARGDYEGGSYGAGSTRGDGQIAWGGNPSRPPGGFAGRGPKGYVRTDERIREDVCERLSADDDVDASDIEVRVEGGEVTLEGTVQTRRMKHDADNLADEVSGVSDVHNRLRVTKGILSEIKEKISGEENEHHFANKGTKDKPANGVV